ncbi:MAG: TIGR00730 family Rossman fold protein [Rhodothermales bacterium]|nr:TIGR00730 family Rossman fold protein [Rhodothermales bacterium]
MLKPPDEPAANAPGDSDDPGHDPSSAEARAAWEVQSAVDWQQARVKDLWRVFRIMGEFVEGFETMSEISPCVSIFGSARTRPDHGNYLLAVDVAKALVQRGFGVISGGGPGIMEAANRGAREANGVSVGLNINIPFEQHSNPYIDPDRLVEFDFFFVRKVMFVKYAQGFVVLPGGFGTIDDLLEALTLIQTEKSTQFPVVLMGTEFWSGLIDWLKNTMLEEGNISEKDLDLFRITDDPDEAARLIAHFYEHKVMLPNF